MKNAMAAALVLAVIVPPSLARSADTVTPGSGQATVSTNAPGPTVPAAMPPGQSPATAGAPSANDYRIGPEDLLDIAVWNNAALSRTTPVRPDGKISLPLLNDIDAAGLTPMQLRDVIAKKLVDYMPNPEVSVIVREVNRFKVSVLGEVRKPGRFDFKSKATVLDAIALAGGLSDFAARSRIVILRQDGAATKRIPVNYNKIISSSSEDDLYLQPGDVVVVP